MCYNIIMNTYTNLNLKKFIDLYYSIKGGVLPSLNFISNELGIPKSELRTLVSYFQDCNYLYRNGKSYCIFETKRNFSKHTDIKDKGTYFLYLNKNYSISFNKFEMWTLEPNFEIETIEDLIYMLFLFTMEYNVLIKPIIYKKNNVLWYKKECYSYKDNSVLYMCEFTQNNGQITLINE